MGNAHPPQRTESPDPELDTRDNCAPNPVFLKRHDLRSPPSSRVELPCQPPQLRCVASPRALQEGEAVPQGLRPAPSKEQWLWGRPPLPGGERGRLAPSAAAGSPQHSFARYAVANLPLSSAPPARQSEGARPAPPARGAGPGALRGRERREGPRHGAAAGAGGAVRQLAERRGRVRGEAAAPLTCSPVLAAAAAILESSSYAAAGEERELRGRQTVPGLAWRGRRSPSAPLETAVPR